MLVLARKKDEEFLFPQLGISIKVVDTGTKTVRIGVNAPREIQVVRSELDLKPDAKATAADDPASGVQPASRELNALQRERELENKAILAKIDQANLAIHLAQNQLRQGMMDNAEQALQDAIEFLCSIESGLVGYSAEPAGFRSQASADSYAEHRSPAMAVHETESKYQTSKASMKDQGCAVEPLAMDLKSPRANDLAQTKRQLEWVAKRFRQAGLTVVLDHSPEPNARSIDFTTHSRSGDSTQL